MLSVQILGRMRIWHADREVDAGPPARRLVLGLLALNSGRLTTRRELLEVLWGESPPSRAVNVLQTHAKHVRRLLDPGRSPRDRGGVLSTVGDGYLLNLDHESLDLLRFRRLADHARAAEVAGDSRGAAGLLREALRLWEDEALCDVPLLEGHPKVLALQAELRQAQLGYCDLMLRGGNPAEVFATLAGAAAAQPLDEARQARLVRAYHASGQTSLAFGHYERTRLILAEELGVDPGVELAAAHRHLLEVAAHPAVSRIPRNLPAPVPDFTGRTGEMRMLDALHSAGVPGVVVLCGTAGVGKTAAAVQWGHLRRDAFPAGQLFLDLRGDDGEHALSPHDALGRLLSGLGVSDHDIPVDAESRAAYWRTETSGRKLLVLLDNAASADHVRPLLPGTHDTFVLVTSRDSLTGLVALYGAARVELDLLPAADAVQLLMTLLGERARTDPAAVASLTTICARLPLALRLAAEFAGAQAHLSLAGVAARLERTGPLRALDAGDSAAIRHVFDCSYRSLDFETKRLFRLLSLNPARYSTLACAAEVSGMDESAAARHLHRLTTTHLLRCDSVGRFGFHDLLYAYADDLSRALDAQADRDGATDRLLEYYLRSAVAASDALYPGWRETRHRAGIDLGPAGVSLTTAAALSWLDSELPAFAAVCDFAVRQGRPRHALNIAAAVHRYLEAGHATEALAIYTPALNAAHDVDDPQAEAHLRTNLAVMYRLLGRYRDATRELQVALGLYARTGNPHGKARALSNLGIVEERLGEFTSSAARHREALALSRQIGDPFGQAAALTNLGNLESTMRQHAQAAEHFAQAHVIFAALGDRAGQAITLTNLGEMHNWLGEGELAVLRLREALALFRGLEHRDGVATALANLGAALNSQGLPQEAMGYLEEAVAIFHATGNRYGQASALNTTGEALLAIGRDDEAGDCHSEALTIATETGDEDEEARARTALERLTACS